MNEPDATLETLLQKMQALAAEIHPEEPAKKAQLNPKPLKYNLRKIQKLSTATDESIKILKKIAKDVKNGATDFKLTMILNCEPFHISSSNNIDDLKEEALANLASATIKIESAE